MFAHRHYVYLCLMSHCSWTLWILTIKENGSCWLSMSLFSSLSMATLHLFISQNGERSCLVSPLFPKHFRLFFTIRIHSNYLRSKIWGFSSYRSQTSILPLHHGDVRCECCWVVCLCNCSIRCQLWVLVCQSADFFWCSHQTKVALTFKHVLFTKQLRWLPDRGHIKHNINNAHLSSCLYLTGYLA